MAWHALLGKEEGAMDIHDETHTNLLGLRRTIYLTIMSRWAEQWLFSWAVRGRGPRLWV